MTELAVSFSVQIMRTLVPSLSPLPLPPADAPSAWYWCRVRSGAQLLLLWAAGAEGKSTGAWAQSSMMVQLWLLAGSVAGMLSQCGGCREELVSLASARDSWWLCQQASPQHPGDGRAFHLHSDQVTFRSAGGRGRAKKWSPWGDEGHKAKGFISQVSSSMNHQQGPYC